VDIVICDETIYPNCAPKEAIEEVLVSGFIGLQLTDRLMNQKKPGDPY
jgi:hypothetical protein